VRKIQKYHKNLKTYHGIDIVVDQSVSLGIISAARVNNLWLIYLTLSSLIAYSLANFIHFFFLQPLSISLCILLELTPSLSPNSNPRGLADSDLRRD
jgi:hypothetical protein